MKKEMLINVLQPEETRVAILEDGKLDELYVERISNEGFVGNIYKGKIVNIEPSIQAAFVDFGVGRNGFLHISDVDPVYFGGNAKIEDWIREMQQERPAQVEPRSGRPGSDMVDLDDEAPNDGSDMVDLDDEAPNDGADVADLDDEAPNDGADVAEPTRHQPEQRRRSAGRDRNDRDRRPRRRGRRQGGGADDSLETDLPKELTSDSSSLPDLDDYQVDEESDPLATMQPEWADDARPEEVVVETVTPEPETESVPEPEEQEEEEAFGIGLLDEETAGSDAKAGGRNDDPPIEPAPGVHRRTGPPDEDDDFGGGLLDDATDEDFEKEDDDLDVEQGKSDDDQETTPRPADEDSPLVTWSEDDEAEPVVPEEKSPSTPAPASGADGPDAETTDGKRRRRRGGRRRRGRDRPGDESPGVAHEPTPADADIDVDVDVEPVESHDQAPPADDDNDEDGSDRRRTPRRGPRRNGRGGGARRPRERPPIQDIFRRGQEVLVQVIKEGIGNKGPTLSTYISVPGRYLVLMPGLNRVGVSRKIVDDEQRRRLRDIVQTLDRPNGVGLIIRTAGLERTKRDLERDLSYLTRLWDVVMSRIGESKAPAGIYQESDMIIRTIRDVFTSEIDEIVVDESSACDRAREFLQLIMPRHVDRLKLYDKPEPLFHKYGIEEEISRIQERAVPLPQGGSIVVDQTEALVAIDVNSGNFRADGDAEETAFQINLTAAREIARQLRLRDLGGVIVNDFIDMREERHRRAVENALRDAVKRDRARTKVLRMSAFGLIEMTRQRIRPSLKRSLYRECPICAGTAQVKTVESMAIDCMRLLTYIGQQGKVRRVHLALNPEIAEYLLNHKRRDLMDLEASSSVTITIVGRILRSPEDIEISCHDAGGLEVKIDRRFTAPAPRR